MPELEEEKGTTPVSPEVPATPEIKNSNVESASEGEPNAEIAKEHIAQAEKNVVELQQQVEGNTSVPSPYKEEVQKGTKAIKDKIIEDIQAEFIALDNERRRLNNLGIPVTNQQYINVSNKLSETFKQLNEMTKAAEVPVASEEAESKFEEKFVVENPPVEPQVIPVREVPGAHITDTMSYQWGEGGLKSKVAEGIEPKGVGLSTPANQEIPLEQPKLAELDVEPPTPWNTKGEFEVPVTAGEKSEELGSTEKIELPKEEALRASIEGTSPTDFISAAVEQPEKDKSESKGMLYSEGEMAYLTNQMANEHAKRTENNRNLTSENKCFELTRLLRELDENSSLTTEEKDQIEARQRELFRTSFYPVITNAISAINELNKNQNATYRMPELDPKNQDEGFAIEKKILLDSVSEYGGGLQERIEKRTEELARLNPDSAEYKTVAALLNRLNTEKQQFEQLQPYLHKTKESLQELSGLTEDEIDASFAGLEPVKEAKESSVNEFEDLREEKKEDEQQPTQVEVAHVAPAETTPIAPLPTTPEAPPVPATPETNREVLVAPKREAFVNAEDEVKAWFSGKDTTSTYRSKWGRIKAAANEFIKRDKEPEMQTVASDIIEKATRAMFKEGVVDAAAAVNKVLMTPGSDSRYATFTGTNPDAEGLRRIIAAVTAKREYDVINVTSSAELLGKTMGDTTGKSPEDIKALELSAKEKIFTEIVEGEYKARLDVRQAKLEAEQAARGKSRIMSGLKSAWGWYAEQHWGTKLAVSSIVGTAAIAGGLTLLGMGGLTSVTAIGGMFAGRAARGAVGMAGGWLGRGGAAIAAKGVSAYYLRKRGKENISATAADVRTKLTEGFDNKATDSMVVIDALANAQKDFAQVEALKQRIARRTNIAKALVGIAAGAGATIGATQIEALIRPQLSLANLKVEVPGDLNKPLVENAKITDGTESTMPGTKANVPEGEIKNLAGYEVKKGQGIWHGVKDQIKSHIANGSISEGDLKINKEQLEALKTDIADGSLTKDNAAVIDRAVARVINANNMMNMGIKEQGSVIIWTPDGKGGSISIEGKGGGAATYDMRSARSTSAAENTGARTNSVENVTTNNGATTNIPEGGRTSIETTTSTSTVEEPGWYDGLSSSERALAEQNIAAFNLRNGINLDDPRSVGALNLGVILKAMPENVPLQGSYKIPMSIEVDGKLTTVEFEVPVELRLLRKTMTIPPETLENESVADFVKKTIAVKKTSVLVDPEFIKAEQARQAASNAAQPTAPKTIEQTTTTRPKDLSTEPTNTNNPSNLPEGQPNQPQNNQPGQQNDQPNQQNSGQQQQGQIYNPNEIPINPQNPYYSPMPSSTYNVPADPYRGARYTYRTQPAVEIVNGQNVQLRPNSYNNGASPRGSIYTYSQRSVGTQIPRTETPPETNQPNQ